MRLVKFVAPLALVLLASPAFGHFLWLSTTMKPGEKPVLQLCFSEEAAPGEADLVDRIADAKVWLHAPGKQPAVQTLDKQVQENTGYWGTPIEVQGTAVTATKDYGILSRGGKTFLLQYYAKYLDATQPEVLENFARTETLAVDLVPQIADGKCSLQVLFQGKPVGAETQVVVLSPSHSETELMTDASGKVSIPLEEAGQYAIRARVRQDEAGKRGDKEYPYAMHYSTLTLKVAGDK